MSDNPTVTRFCVTCGLEATVHADSPLAWGLFFCAEHRGQMNSDQQRADRFARLERRAIGPGHPEDDPSVTYAGIGDGSHSPYCECAQCTEPDEPTFIPTDRQRRRIAGARAWIAQRLDVPYSGELDTGTVHGPDEGPLQGPFARALREAGR